MEQLKDNPERKEDIIATAQKWFGLYGFKKTSMIDIANDLRMSKGLLYYYFPDKEHLYMSVVQKEVTEFKSEVSAQLAEISEPIERLQKFIAIRLDHFRKLLNLSRFRLGDMGELKSAMTETWKSLHDYEKSVIVEILISGNESQQFNVNNPQKIAELLFDLLRGIRLGMIKDKQLFYLDQQDYELLQDKTQTFLDIFIKGLACKD